MTTFTAEDVLINEIPFGDGDQVVKSIGPIHLEGGKSYLVWHQYGCTSVYGTLMSVRSRIHAAGVPSSYSRLSTRNHEGEENGLAPGVVRAVGGRYLFTPPSTGEYVVDLLCQSACMHPEHANEHTTIVPSQTILTIDDAPKEDAIQWEQPSELHVNLDVQSTWILANRLEMPPNATGIQVCSAAEVSCESTGGASPFVALVELYVTQLTAQYGTKCQRQTKLSRLAIPGVLHHYKFNQFLSMPVDVSCTSHWFAIQTKLTYEPAPAGEPERHGGLAHDYHYSYAYAYPTFN